MTIIFEFALYRDVCLSSPPALLLLVIRLRWTLNDDKKSTTADPSSKANALSGLYWQFMSRSNSRQFDARRIPWHCAGSSSDRHATIPLRGNYSKPPCLDGSAISNHSPRCLRRDRLRDRSAGASSEAWQSRGQRFSSLIDAGVGGEACLAKRLSNANSLCPPAS